jgi:hypothetical protein
MTTTQAPTLPELRLAGVLLLEALVERLRAVGYVKTAIDTHTDLMNKHTIRHSYSGGEWTLSCGYDGQPRLEVRYSIRATMPSVDQLANAVLPPPF